jgi:hypothetical protein
VAKADFGMGGFRHGRISAHFCAREAAINRPFALDDKAQNPETPLVGDFSAVRREQTERKTHSA